MEMLVVGILKDNQKSVNKSHTISRLHNKVSMF